MRKKFLPIYCCWVLSPWVLPVLVMTIWKSIHYDILPEDFMYRNEANIKSGLYGIYDTFYTYQAVIIVAMIRHGDLSPMYLLPDTVRWIARHPAGMPNGNVMRY